MTNDEKIGLIVRRALIVFVVVFMAYNTYKNYQISANGIEVEATIDSIREQKNRSKDGYTSISYVGHYSYSHKGGRYSGSVGVSKGTPRGERLTITYNSKNPKQNYPYSCRKGIVASLGLAGFDLLLWFFALLVIWILVWAELYERRDRDSSKKIHKKRGVPENHYKNSRSLKSPKENPTTPSKSKRVRKKKRRGQKV